MDNFNIWREPKKNKNSFINLDLGYEQQKIVRDTRRSFTRTQKNEIIYQQNNKCARCHKKLDPRAIEFDHKRAWAAGGRTITVNGRAVCGTCHKIITHEGRLKKADKKKKERKNYDLFGLSKLEQPPKHSRKNMFGL